MAGNSIRIDLSQYSAFFARLQAAARGDFKKELELFIEALGIEFLRLCEDEIMRRKVVDTRLLLNSFQKGDSDNVWIWSDGKMKLEVGTNVEYAKYVNDGHWTCSKGEIGRFIPGDWQGDKFVYNPGSKTGMYLKQQWVEGKHYWESALKIMEKMYPQFLDKKLDEWLRKYFGDLM
ncbi:MAG: HK97 gp10 family phage protein [Oscillospiraceae bacterium]|nr:HK97 gp10 family phage protein [Oscillospiraceae bacterium]